MLSGVTGRVTKSCMSSCLNMVERIRGDDAMPTKSIHGSVMVVVAAIRSQARG